MDALTHIRKEVFGLSQAGMAAALAVNQSTVSRWERGESAPRQEHLAAIRGLAKQRGVSWDDSWLFESARTSEAA